MTREAMNCKLFRQTILEGAPEACAHVRECRACAIAVHNRNKLVEALAALAHMETRGPSPALEAALLREFRPPVQKRNWGQATVLAGSLAAGCAIAFLVQPGARDLNIARKSPPPQVSVRPPAQPVTREPVSEPLRVPRRSSRRQPRTESPGMDFVAVPFAAPLEPNESAQLVRVSMPVGTLAAWGFSLGSSDPGREIDADLVVGQDGLARAIRLVR